MAQSSTLTGTLNLVILDAYNLKIKDWNTMDPYCVIEFKDQIFQTRPALKGHQNPTWNQTFELPVAGANLKDIICFKVMDKEMIKDNKIGKAILTLQELADYCRSDKGMNIELETFGLFDKDKPAGTLRIKPFFSGTVQSQLDNKSLPQHNVQQEAGGIGTGVGTGGVGGRHGTTGVGGRHGTTGVGGRHSAGLGGVGTRHSAGTHGVTGVRGTHGMTGVSGTHGMTGVSGTQGVSGPGVSDTQGVSGSGFGGTQGVSGGIGGPQVSGSGVGGPHGVSSGVGGPQGVSSGVGGPQGVSSGVGPQGVSSGVGPQGVSVSGPHGVSSGVGDPQGVSGAGVPQGVKGSGIGGPQGVTSGRIGGPQVNTGGTQGFNTGVGGTGLKPNVAQPLSQQPQQGGFVDPYKTTDV